MKKIILFLLSATAVFTLAACSSMPVASAQSAGAGGGGSSKSTGSSSAAEQVCQGANALEGGGGCNQNGSNRVLNLLKNVVNLLSWIVGVVAVIMVILGGFWIITANGDAQKVGRARGTIIYALVGLIIVALAQVLVRFVISNI